MNEYYKWLQAEELKRKKLLRKSREEVKSANDGEGKRGREKAQAGRNREETDACKRSDLTQAA